MAGNEKFRTKIKDLVIEYRDIFSTTLGSEPAYLPPMELEVDKSIWEVPANRTAPRPQTGLKENEIQKQIEKMLPNNIVRPSEAAHYSQAHMVPKPEGKWRFCLDYRNLNKALKALGWPIPNINEMLQRIGAKRPKVFAKLDLTSGYHQAPLAVNSRIYTAFITFMGMFEWLRIPMGLKNATSYFQKMLASIVLVGLIFYICEWYVDDVIV